MSFLYFCALLVALCYSQCGPEQTASNEGCCSACYLDTVGVPTIGIGFNLKRSDAQSVLSRYGLDYHRVVSGCHSTRCVRCGSTNNATWLSQSNAFQMFSNILYPPFVSCADAYSPGLPHNVRNAVIDMAYNLGCAGLNSFKSMKASLAAKKWSQAATDAGNSRWCGQVGGRCARDQACIRSGA